MTWVSFVGSEEPSLKILHSVELLRTNSSQISNRRRSKLAIFLSHNINYNINSLLWLHVGTHIIYIYISDERYIPEVEMKTILNNKIIKKFLSYVVYITENLELESWKSNVFRILNTRMILLTPCPYVRMSDARLLVNHIPLLLQWFMCTCVCVCVCVCLCVCLYV